MVDAPRLSPIDADALVAHDGDVYIAGQPAPQDFDAWVARGATTVVNMRSQAETAALPFDSAAEAKSRGLRYVAIPMGGHDGMDARVRTTLTETLAAANGPVVLYCRSGSRCAHAYAAHLLATGGAQPQDLNQFGWPGGLSVDALNALLQG